MPTPVVGPPGLSFARRRLPCWRRQTDAAGSPADDGAALSRLSVAVAFRHGCPSRFMRAMSTAVTSTASSDLRPAAELVGWAGPELTEMARLLRAACREYQACATYRVNGAWITYVDCGPGGDQPSPRCRPRQRGARPFRHKRAHADLPVAPPVDLLTAWTKVRCRPAGDQCTIPHCVGQENAP